MLRKSTWSILIIVATFVLPATLFTQDDSSPRRLYSTTEKLLQFKQYNEAVPVIEELLKINPNNSNYNFKMAYAIIRGSSQKDPIPYLEKAVQDMAKPGRYRSRVSETAAPIEALWFLGLQKFYTYNYEEAALLLQKYKLSIVEQHDNYKMCTEYIASCESAQVLMQKPHKVKILDFSEATTINNFVHSPLFSPDGSVFIFTADRNPEKENYKIEHVAYNDDIFYIYKNKRGKWSEPQPLSSNINSEKKEASVGMHPNGKQILIYREDNGDGNIYYSDLIDSNMWSPLKKFPEPINTSANETHATISANGRVIYFTSDREGGFGGLDIYMSILSHDSIWGAAINLGPVVNSEHIEESPHIQANSNLLYFSSNRPGGMGDFDVYRSEIVNDTVAKNITNIGYPINTPQSDLFFKTSLDGGRAYYSSPCTSTNGELDIQIVAFQDKILFPNVIVKGVVLDADNDTLKGHEITLFNLSVRDITDSTQLDPKTGYYSFNLHSKNNYFASIEYGGFVYFSKPFKLAKYFADYTFENVIELDPIYISDSTMRQNEGTFMVFKNNMNRPADDPIFDTIPNIFVEIDSIPTQTVSRVNTVIDPEEKHNREVLALQLIEPIVQPPLVDTNELIELPQPTEPIDIVEVQPIIDLPVTPKVPRIDPPIVKAQNNEGFMADSLLNLGVEGLHSGEYNNSMNDIRLAMSLYDSLQDVEKQVLCIEYLADAEYNKGQLNNSLELHKASLALIEDNFNSQEISDKKKEIADIYDDLYYFDEAIGLFESSLSIQKDLDNKEEISELYYNIADAYSQNNEQEKAIELLEESLEYNTTQKKKAETYNRIGVSHHQLQQIIKAIDYYNKSVTIASKIDDKSGLALYHNNLGNAYFDLKELEEALIHYNISLDLQKELLNDRGIAMVMYNIGNVNKSKGKHTIAIDNFNQSISLAEKVQDTKILAKNFFAIMQVYKILGNHKLALQYYKKYYSIASPIVLKETQMSQFMFKHIVSNDDIQLLEAKMRRSEELLKFEKVKYEKELTLLEQKDQLLKITRYALGGAMIAVFFILILLLLRYRTRRRFYKQLAIQNAEILQKQEEITVQRENLEGLHNELEKLSIVASKTANTVAILQPDSQIEWTNTAFVAQYKNQTNSFLDFANSADEKAQIQNCIDTKESILYETERLTAQDNNIWVQCMLTPIIANDEIFKIIVIEADITEQKKNELEIKAQRDEIQEQTQEIQQQRDVAVTQASEIASQKETIEHNLGALKGTQKKLIESEKMASLGNLVAGISHEINTPVGIGVAAASSLSSRTESLKELFGARKMKQSDLQNYLMSTQEAANLIQSNLNRTGNLVKSFKQVSVDEMTDQKRTFKLKEYIQEVLTSMSAETSDRDIDIKINCPKTIEITSYPGAFAQIITNMLRNVLMYAYTPDQKAVITITARIIDNRLHFQFADKGKGMPEEVIQKVFNPFFTTNMQAGKGLGMNLVYNTVNKQLQGDISCTSTEGKGTTFTMDIPIQK